MDLIQDNNEEQIERSKKMMLWFAMISFIMAFAGLISAYIISKERNDWLTDYKISPAFVWSTVVILLSSASFYAALLATKKDNRNGATISLLITLILGVLFCYLQFEGFSELIDLNGYHFAGKGSSVTTSFVFLIVALHLAHIIAGMIALLVVIYNHFKQRYNSSQTLGIELAATFWHFLDFLWICLFLFFYFVR